METEPMRLDAIIADLPEGQRADYTVGLRFGDCAIHVKSNVPALIDRLTRDYRPFVRSAGAPTFVISAIQGAPPGIPGTFTVRPTSSVRGPKEEWQDFADGRVVRKLRTEMVFLMRGREHVAIGDCLANPNQVVNFINSRYLNWLMRDGGLLLHAAGVSRGDTGVALTGFPGAGKSTQALHLMREGCDFISNDRLVIRAGVSGLRMDGLPKHPRVNPGTLLNNPALTEILPRDRRDALAKLPAAELWALEEKYDVIIAEQFGPERVRLSADARSLYVMNWNRVDEPTDIEAVDLNRRRDLLPAITKSRGVFADGPVELTEAAASPDEYVVGLQGCLTFEVVGGVSFEAVARHCAELLDMKR